MSAWQAAPERCTVTHHTGCACHEERRDAEVSALRTRAETLTAERDALRAEWQRHVKGTEDTVRLLLPHTIAAARREGAEAMRDALAAMVGRRVAAWDDDADEHGDDDAATRWEEATAIYNAIRALPLPGDATEHAPTPAPVCPAPTEGT